MARTMGEDETDSRKSVIEDGAAWRGSKTANGEKKRRKKERDFKFGVLGQMY